MSEHESGSEKPRDIGLKAVREARFERSKSKHGRMTGKTWLVVGSAVAVAVTAAVLFKDRTLAVQKEELFSKQRAAIATVGAEWNPLREKIEKLTIEAAGPYAGDLIAPELAGYKFRSAPGIWFRGRVAEAKDAAEIRKQAEDSGRDGFIGCFLRENNPSWQHTIKGEDAGSGWYDQPWNLRLAYRATRILTDEWTQEARDSEDEIHLRVFVQQYEKAKNEEIPLTIDIVKRAQFYLFVLDEDVPEAVAMAPDAGRNAGKVSEKDLQQLAHPARVHLVDLKSGKTMLRLRRSAEADYRFAGEYPVRDPYTASALKRQVNNCALAQAVLAEMDEADAGAPSAP